MTAKEKVEFEALQFAQVPSLPEKAGEDTPWASAIAKVLTFRGNESYVIVRRNFTGGNPIIVKMFDEEGVSRITSVHPYKMIDLSVLPEFKNPQELKAYLAKSYGKTMEEMNAVPGEKIRLLYHNLAVKVAEQKDEEMRLREEAREARIQENEERRKAEESMAEQTGNVSKERKPGRPKSSKKNI